MREFQVWWRNSFLRVRPLAPTTRTTAKRARKQRGLAIAALVPIKRNRLGYQIPSQSDNGSYVVNLDDEPFCSCPDFEKRQEPCKHIYATSYALQRETHSWKETKAAPDDIEAAPEPKSYWQVYNLAQVNEQEMFGILLRGTCAIPCPCRPRRVGERAVPRTH